MSDAWTQLEITAAVQRAGRPLGVRNGQGEIDWNDPEQVRAYKRDKQREYVDRLLAAGLKRCSSPKHEGPNPLPLDEFYRDKTKKDGRTSACKKCKDAARDKAADNRRHLERYWARKYPGMSMEEARRTRQAEQRRKDRHGSPSVVEELWEAQAGLCYLCEEPLPPIGSRSLHIDHDHRCCKTRSCPACRRGLTHGSCNTAIGLAGEDPAKLRRLADNLERVLSELQLKAS